VRDTDGDDKYDSVELLKALPGRGGEHGPHSITLSPDGKSLYVVAGNSTVLPTNIVPSKTSLMPIGLLDTLSEDAIFDLIAYLESAGNPDAPNFKAGQVRD